MDDAWLGAFAAAHFAGYQPHAAGATVASAAVIGQVDAVFQSRIQQQLAPARRKALPIDRNLVTSRHSLFLGLVISGRCGEPPLLRSLGMSAKPSVREQKPRTRSAVGMSQNRKYDHYPMLRLDHR